MQKIVRNTLKDSTIKRQNYFRSQERCEAKSNSIAAVTNCTKGAIWLDRNQNVTILERKQYQNEQIAERKRNPNGENEERKQYPNI